MTAVPGAGHRHDIDGLRAIAILPVVLYHARIPGLAGGFTGVDVFFVISGYLITRLILRDMDAGTFTIAAFYERRVRRILPALCVVLAAATIAAWALFLPDDLRQYGQTLLATVVFLSNVAFLRQDYFNQAADTKPLLHTWSLAVEEQFYIAYPLFLWLVHRVARRRYVTALALVFVASLATSLVGTRAAPAAAFYLAPARAWELVLGGLLALEVVPSTRRPALADSLGLLGLSGILAAAAAFTESTPFPGAAALLPAGGAALVIHAGTTPGSRVARTLGWRPFVFVGLISYSWYLWHWVCLVFARYWLVRPLAAGEIALVVGASAIVAVLSWRFVETPFRGRRGIGTRREVFAGAASVSVALAAAGLLAAVRPHAITRFPEAVRALQAGGADRWSRHAECRDQVCTIGAAGARPTFLLWGDSHARALAPAFDRAAAEAGLGGIVVSQSACAPLFGLRRFDRDREPCTALHDSARALLAHTGITRVFLHGRWGSYGQSRGGSGRLARLTATGRIDDNAAAFERLLDTTLAELRRTGLHVVLIASVPEAGADVPVVLARELGGARLGLAPTAQAFAERQRRTFAILRRITARHGVPVVYPHELLCDSTTCPIIRDGRGLYIDTHHLSLPGAARLEPMVRRLLDPATSP